jgi:NADH-quinone oxidoreductase subunit B
LDLNSTKKPAPKKSEGNFLALNSEDILDWIDDTIEYLLEYVQGRKILNMTPARDIFTWGYRESPWILHFGIMCCALEMAAAGGPRFDMERFGIISRSSPRQVDVLIINGPVSRKVAPRLVRIYEQMPEPKWVVAMGECAISGGPFWESYNVLEGVDKIIPVDIYIPGCPARPDAMLDGFLKLRKKLRAEKELKAHIK